MISTRLNNISHFNFFFKNTKKNLIIDQNFICNQFLTQKLRLFFNTSKGSKSSKSNGDSYAFNNVASKVLTCQEPETKTPHDSHIPFKTTPRASSPKNSSPKASQPSFSPQSLTDSNELRQFIKPYIKLTKPNLTILVTLSSICSYALSPCSVSLPELGFLSLGTMLCSGAANAINMGREPEFDKKMPRTANRPVVRDILTSEQAYKFAGLTGSTGVAMLLLGVNETVALLGFINIVLYSWIYTSLKRISIINTWAGAVVGAIPPLMGWAASTTLNHPGAWCLAGLLYAWQFPHFNALSHNVAEQYKSAGYVMTAAENPKLNARVSLRYSLLMFPICFGLSYFDITDWVFQVDSAILNSWLALLAYKFWYQQTKNYSSKLAPTTEGINMANIHARKLFWGSVWHLPGVLILAMLHKKDQWDRLLGFVNDKFQ